MTLVTENDVQPAEEQSMMTVMTTSVVVKNPGGIRHVPEFPTIDFTCYPDSYCSTMINEEHLISGTHGKIVPGIMTRWYTSPAHLQ